MLSYLRCKNVGPTAQIEIEPAKRLNLLVGDNGLGKSFILEIVWWILCGKWAQYPAQPKTGASEAEIAYKFSDGFNLPQFTETEQLAESSAEFDLDIKNLLASNDPSFEEWFEEPEEFVAKAAPFYELGEISYDQGKYLEAKSYFRKALSKYKSLSEQIGIARATWQLGRIDSVLANYDDAEKCFEESRALSEQIGDQRGLAKALSSLGRIYQVRADFANAMEFHVQALKIDEQVIGKEHPDYARHLNSLAITYDGQGKYEEAIELYKQATVIDEKTIGKDHPDYAKSLSRLALAYHAQGKYEEAIKLFKHAIAIDVKMIGKNHQNYASHLNNLANTYNSQGKYEEALELYKQVIAIDEETIGKNHPEYAKSLNNLANAYDSQGKHEEALELYKQVIVIDEKTIGKDHPEYAGHLNNLASVYYSQGKHEEALELYKQVIVIDEKTIGKDHPHYAGHLNNLALAYDIQGKKTEAEKIRKDIESIKSKKGKKPLPTKREISQPEIKYGFDASELSWTTTQRDFKPDGLIVYSRVDGSYAVWDSMRAKIEGLRSDKVLFSRNEVWNGDAAETQRIEGLLRDWVKWQNNRTDHPFEIFEKVLKKLSPPDLGALKPGQPTRFAGDAREIPTIEHPYGTVAVIHSSAAVRRILSLAYMIVWAWNEHKVYAKLYNRAVQRKMFVLVDEIEAHLHPQWQRTALAALLEVGRELDQELDIQFFVASHSPLVTASLESLFEKERDALFHLKLGEKSNAVEVEKLDFYAYGTIDAWLTSDLFGLKQSSSKARELAIEEALALQKKTRPSKAAIKKVNEKLVKYLAQHDEFWPQWLYFISKHDVKI